jgi:integrase
LRWRNVNFADAKPTVEASWSAAGHLDPSALRRRYRRTQEPAGLRPLRFHDLCHSFGSLVIREFDPVAVKDFMGHSK